MCWNLPTCPAKHMSLAGSNTCVGAGQTHVSGQAKHMCLYPRCYKTIYMFVVCFMVSSGCKNVCQHGSSADKNFFSIIFLKRNIFPVDILIKNMKYNQI